jgi:hypothetical protein
MTPEARLDAIRFRRAFGLREDDAWISAVAANPLSEVGRQEFGVPLLPFELQDLLDRTAADPEVVHVIESYGAAKPADWAGLFVDQKAGGVIVAQFRDHLDDHRAAIDRLLSARAHVEVRKVDWSLNELHAFALVVETDGLWFETVAAHLYAADVLEMGNVVRVRYDGDPEAVDVIVDHFGSPSWLQVKWQGPLPWTGPVGGLIVTAVDIRGRPVSGLGCDFEPDDRTAVFWTDDLYFTRENGQCGFPTGLPAVEWRIEIEARDGEILGSAHTRVAPGLTTTITIEVPVPAGS